MSTEQLSAYTPSTTQPETKEAKGRRVVGLSLDYDGCMDACFYNSFIENPQFIEREDISHDHEEWKKAHDHMHKILRDKTTGASEVIVFVGSNRQSSQRDWQVDHLRHNGLCFEKYAQLCEQMNKQNKEKGIDQTWVFNKLLYVDTFNGHTTGTSMNNPKSEKDFLMTQIIPDQCRSDFPSDLNTALKVLFLSEQLKLMPVMAKPGDKTDFYFIDDRQGITEDVHTHFYKQAAKIPAGINFHVTLAAYYDGPGNFVISQNQLPCIEGLGTVKNASEILEEEKSKRKAKNKAIEIFALGSLGPVPYIPVVFVIGASIRYGLDPASFQNIGDCFTSTGNTILDGIANNPAAILSGVGVYILGVAILSYAHYHRAKQTEPAAIENSTPLLHSGSNGP